MQTAQRGSAALLWDESFLWGIMAYKALQAAGLPFDLVRSEDIRMGCLDGYSLLFVPGGWSSNKMKALGEAGAEAIRDFVQGGGHYLGFCGGAGLATDDGIGLLAVKRKPTNERVPSFSGRIRLQISEHQAWGGITDPVFHAWWPPQITLQDESIKVLATYRDALPDSFSSDLNTGDINTCGAWAEMEALYRINLDPGRLLNDPAVIEGRFGRGKVVLSLVHFDTLNDDNGRQVLRNLWASLAGHEGKRAGGKGQEELTVPLIQSPVSPEIPVLEASVSEIIDLGIRNFLWFWRDPMLLQWRRGVRGLEYCTLYIMIREIATRLSAGDLSGDAVIEERLKTLSSDLSCFAEQAKRLLVLERLAMQNGNITYERCDEPEIRKIRNKLFSSSKSYGGIFKKLIDELDDLLFLLLQGDGAGQKGR